MKANRAGSAGEQRRFAQWVADRPVTALDHVSLTIQDNAFFTRLGPSGCGKTTFSG